MVTLDYISQLPIDVREKIQACMTLRSLENGDSIYQQNEESDALYQVVSGEVRILNVSREGREVLYVTYHKGDTFGEIGVLDQGGDLTTPWQADRLYYQFCKKKSSIIYANNTRKSMSS